MCYLDPHHAICKYYYTNRVYLVIMGTFDIIKDNHLMIVNDICNLYHSNCLDPYHCHIMVDYYHSPDPDNRNKNPCTIKGETNYYNHNFMTAFNCNSYLGNFLNCNIIAAADDSKGQDVELVGFVNFIICFSSCCPFW